MTPRTYVIFRAAAVTMTALILLLLGLGLSGRGPLGSLGPVTSTTVSWLQVNAGLGTR
jgi:hypothetical protein